MARWKAGVKFLLSVIGFLFYLLRLRRYKAKGAKTRCYQEVVSQFERRFQGEGVVRGEHFFGLYKTRHIFLSDSVNCTVLYAVVLTQYWRVTDRRTGQTVRIAIASTTHAMRALRRAVKTESVGLRKCPYYHYLAKAVVPC